MKDVAEVRYQQLVEAGHATRCEEGVTAYRRHCFGLNHEALKGEVARLLQIAPETVTGDRRELLKTVRACLLPPQAPPQPPATPPPTSVPRTTPPAPTAATRAPENLGRPTPPAPAPTPQPQRPGDSRRAITFMLPERDIALLEATAKVLGDGCLKVMIKNATAWYLRGYAESYLRGVDLDPLLPPALPEDEAGDDEEEAESAPTTTATITQKQREAVEMARTLTLAANTLSPP